MAAQTYGSTSTTTAAPPRVNLLPPEIAERAKLRKAQLAMVGTGLAAVAVVGVLFTQQTAQVAEAKAEHETAVAAQARLRGDLNKLAHVRATYAQVDAANATLAGAMAYDIRWSTYLHDLTLRIPDNVWLNTLTANVTAVGAPGQPAVAAGTGAVLDPGIGQVQFSGTAFAHDDVAAWLESLSKQKGYANPYFTQSVEAFIDERAVVNFTSRVNLTQDALSKRYTKGLAR